MLVGNINYLWVDKLLFNIRHLIFGSDIKEMIWKVSNISFIIRYIYYFCLVTNFYLLLVLYTIFI